MIKIIKHFQTFFVLLPTWCISWLIVGCVPLYEKHIEKELPPSQLIVKHHELHQIPDVTVYCSSPEYNVEVAARTLEYYGKKQEIELVVPNGLCKSDSGSGTSKLLLSDLTTQAIQERFTTLDIDYLVVFNSPQTDFSFFIAPLIPVVGVTQTHEVNMEAVILDIGGQEKSDGLHSIVMAGKDRSHSFYVALPPAAGLQVESEPKIKAADAAPTSLGREVAEYISQSTALKPIKVLVLWTKAAAHRCAEGDADACWSLYEENAKNYRWLCKAADLGNTDARMRLAWVYETGTERFSFIGKVKPDLPRAYLWYKLAESLGVKDGNVGSKRVQEKMNFRELQKADDLFSDWRIGQCRDDFRSLHLKYP